MERSRAVFIWYAEQLTAHKQPSTEPLSVRTAARKEAVETFLENMQAGVSFRAVFEGVEKHGDLYPGSDIHTRRDLAAAIWETLIPLTKAPIKRPDAENPEAFYALSRQEQLAKSDAGKSSPAKPEQLIGLLRAARHATLGNFPAEGNVYEYCGIMREMWDAHFESLIIKRVSGKPVDRTKIRRKIIDTYKRMIEDGNAALPPLYAKPFYKGIFTQSEVHDILKEEGLLAQQRIEAMKATNDSASSSPKRPAKMKKEQPVRAPAYTPEGSIAA